MLPNVGLAFTRITRLAIALLLLASALVAMAPGASAANDVTLRVHLHGCPDGFDGINASIYDFAQFCQTPIGGANVTALYAGLAPSRQTDLDGNWELTEVTAGSVTLMEFPPDSSWLQRAFCAVADANSALSGYTEAPVGQGNATWDLQSGQTLDCEWYNFAVVTPSPVNISVHLHGCPEGFDGINANIYDFAYYCHTPIGGSVIAAVFGNLAPSSQTDLDGNWELTDIPAGSVTVHQFPPDPSWLIRAFCKQSDAYSTSGSYLEAPVGQGSATWNLLSGQRLDCEWYNFPAVTPTTAAVNIRLHSCPNGYDGGSATIYDLAANCHGTPNGVKLTLTPFNAPAQNGQTNQNGMIGWQNVPSGKLSIKQQVPSGVTVQRVFCNQRKLTGEELGFAEVAAAPDGTLTDYLFAGFDAYDCDWFNVSDIAVVDGTPEAGATPIAPGGGDQTGTGNGNDNGNGNGTTTGDSGTGTVSQPTPQSNGGSTGATSLTITLFSCPSGYDLFADDADPAADCLEPVSDVDFTSLGGVSGILATKTTDADGIAKYPKLTSGPHLITEQLPADVDFAFILDCSSNLSDYADSPLYPFAFAGPNGEISIDVQKGEQLSCNWYNVPA